MEDPVAREKAAGVSPISGTAPPKEYQFKPGYAGGPGRPKGADARAALARELARGRDSDDEAADEDGKLGVKAREAGRQILEAAMAGDTKRVKALAEMFNQALGKPKEFIEHSGGSVIDLRIENAAEPETP